MNTFIYSDTNKRYHTLEYYNRKRFGQRVFKASLDAALSCPNIDGTVSTGGCKFCLSGSSAFVPKVRSVKEQLKAEIERIDRKHPNALICAYFQAHTNTYAPLEVLDELYSQVISDDRVKTIAIATRPDCIDCDIADLLYKYSQRLPLTVELGLQTIHDETARSFNRGYDFVTFLKAYDMLKSRGIRVCVHIINGLPFESCQMMLDTAKTLGKLEIDAIKIQLLHILKNTEFEKLYLSGAFEAMTPEDYVQITCAQLRCLSPKTVVERLTGDGKRSELVAPLWSLRKINVLNEIDKYMAKNDIVQGDLF